MKHSHSLALPALAMMLSIPLTGYADGSFYVGGSLGSASLTDDFDGFDVDTDSVALRLIAGWRFNDYFSLEGGYHNFGEFEQSVLVSGERVNVGLKADGFTLGATGSIPLGDKLALFGRAGSFFWDGDAEINDVSQATPEDTNFYFGAGATYSLTDRVSVLADWSRYELEDTESDVLSLGLTVGF